VTSATTPAMASAEDTLAFLRRVAILLDGLAVHVSTVAIVGHLNLTQQQHVRHALWVATATRDLFEAEIMRQSKPRPARPQRES
jgi:hypothetical protein